MKKTYVGIDLGGTSIKLGVMNETGTILNKLEVPTPKTYEDTISLFTKLIKEIQRENEGIMAIGIGVPGFVDITAGKVEEAVNLGWNDVQLKKDLEDNLDDIPVYIDNDANLAALGEMWIGAGQGAKNLICITIGTGIGGGVIVDGEVYHGKNAMAGEIGHMPIRPDSHIKCNCGKVGCLETEVSATAMVHYAKEAVKAGRETTLTIDSTAKDIFDALEKNDGLAKEIIDHTAYYLGMAAAQIASVIAPEKIVIGGGVSKAKSLILNPIKDYFYHFSTTKLAEQTELVLAELSNDAGIVGAAKLANDMFNKEN